MPLTPLQARRINSDLFFRKDPKRWLSPRQQAWWQRIEKGLKDEAVAARLQKLTAPPSVGRFEANLRALEVALDHPDHH